MLTYKTVNLFFVFVLIIVVMLVKYEVVPLYSVLLIFAGWLLITLIGATNVRMNYFFSSYSKNHNVKKKAIALTFDDGPSENTLKILELLKKHQAKACFFCIGHKVDEHPEILKKIIADGHLVGNHTYSHAPNWGFFSTKKVAQELMRCNQAVKGHTGLEMNLFRSPFGISNPKIKRALEQTGHQPIGWSVRSFDALFHSEKLIFKAVTRNLQNGDVILFHDTQPHSLIILEQLLLFLQQKNYHTLSIEALFQIDAYR